MGSEARRSTATRTYYIHGRRESLRQPGGRKTRPGYHYRCFREQTYFLSSYHFRATDAAYIFLREEEERVDLRLKLRKTFPLSGKIDVLQERTETLSGVLSRNGTFYNSREELLGQFVDVRSFRERFGESTLDVVTQIVLGTGDQVVPGGGADRFGLVFRDRPAGCLEYRELPFFPEPTRRRELPQLASVVKKVLPRKMSKQLFTDRPPRGWKLTVDTEYDESEELLILLAALVHLEFDRA